MNGAKLSPKLPDIRVLNEGDGQNVSGQSAVDISKSLQKLMLRMKGELITEDGSGVKYEELPRSPLFSQYKQQTYQLRNANLTALSEDEKIAFFINIYNVLTIHGLSECKELPDSVLNVQLFWRTTAYNIGGHMYSLDDIEHGVLRANRPHPSSTTKPFGPTDPRLKFIVKKFDPRIHFALVCGAKSCPAINVYTASNLNAALDGATRNFCQQEVVLYKVQKHIMVSRIFQWYKVDFGNNDIEAVRWTLPYLDSEKREDLSLLLGLLESQGMVDLSYREYNWNLNKVDKPLTPPTDVLEPPPLLDLPTDSPRGSNNPSPKGSKNASPRGPTTAKSTAKSISPRTNAMGKKTKL